MRLLFVAKTLAPAGGAGGAERVLAEVASGLAGRAHAVTVATFDREGERDFYSMAPSVSRQRAAVGEPSGPTGPLDMVAQVRTLRGVAKDMRPDVAIGVMHSAYLPLAIALAGTRIPLVASEHGSYDHLLERPLHRLLLLAMAGSFRAITTTSAGVRDGFPPRISSRMTVVPNPVVAPDGAAADLRGGDRKTLLCVGRLHELKDHGTLIGAFGRIADRFSDWQLRIVGEGPMRPQLEAQISRLGLEQRIELPGRIEAISAEYRSAQLFAMPSRYESFGLATAEALAHGLPAVGFADCPGTNELIDDGRNGLLVSVADREQGLAEALARLMASSDLRLRLGHSAPDSVSQYRASAVLDRWEEVLEGAAKTCAE